MECLESNLCKGISATDEQAVGIVERQVKVAGDSNGNWGCEEAWEKMVSWDNPAEMETLEEEGGEVLGCLVEKLAQARAVVGMGEEVLVGFRGKERVVLEGLEVFRGMVLGCWGLGKGVGVGCEGEVV